MGNQQSYMCDNCSPMQVEDTQYDDHRMTFQMTKMRQFSHYSRDFQVEQKYNRIVTSKPGYQLQLELVYPSRLDYLKAQLMEKSGRDRKVDEEDQNDQYRFDKAGQERQGSNGKMKRLDKQDDKIDKEKLEIQEILGVQDQQQKQRNDQEEDDDREGQDMQDREDQSEEEFEEDRQEEIIDDDQNDSSADIYYKSFKLGNIELDCNILCNEFEVMYEQCVVDSREITQRAAKTDVFIFLLDDELDLPLCDYVVQLISQSCQKHAVVFLAAAKSVTSISFLAGYSTLVADNIQEHDVIGGQGSQYQEEEKNPQLNKYFKNKKENVEQQQKQLREPLIVRDNDTSQIMKSSPVKKERTILQKWVKSIIDNYWNTDFVLFDFDSSDTINAQFEVILAQAIYSQDSQFNQQVQ